MDSMKGISNNSQQPMVSTTHVSHLKYVILVLTDMLPKNVPIHVKNVPLHKEVNMHPDVLENMDMNLQQKTTIPPVCHSLGCIYTQQNVVFQVYVLHLHICMRDIKITTLYAHTMPSIEETR